MTSSPEMFIKKIINFLRGFHFPKLFTKPSFERPFGLSNILHPSAFSLHVRAYITSVEFQSNLESLRTENCLLLTFETIVLLQLRYLQKMQHLALHLEMDGYIPLLLYGFLYFRRIGDFIGESLILRRLWKMLLFELPCKLMDDAE